MNFKTFRLGKSKEKSGKESEANDKLATQLASLEEHVKERTRQLEEAEQRLKQISNGGQAPKKEDDVPLKPHGPIGELSLEPEANLEGENTVPILPIEEVKKEAPMADLKMAEIKIEAVTKIEVKKEAPAKVEDDSLTNLFSQEEENNNPLATLINALPDVTVQELVDDLQEIKEIIKEWQHK